MVDKNKNYIAFYNLHKIKIIENLHISPVTDFCENFAENSELIRS